MLLKKALLSDRVNEDDCLLVFVLLRDNIRVLMHMSGTIVSLKSQQNKVIVNCSI